MLLFVLTLSIDHAAFHHQLSLPSWVISGSPDAAREILAALALTAAAAGGSGHCLGTVQAGLVPMPQESGRLPVD